MPTVNPVINNVYEATDKFLKYLRDISKRGIKYKVRKVIKENNARHRLIIVEEWRGKWKARTIKFYLIYVRKWFETFSKYFNINSLGTSIRLDILERLYKTDVDYIVIIHKTDGIFLIKTDDFYLLAINNNWIRTPEKTGETLANIPIEYLTHVGR